MKKHTRIIIADDHAIVRKGIAQIVQEGLNFPAIVEVNDAESLYAAVVKDNFDLAIVDITLPGRSGLDVIRDIKKVHPLLPVLIISINPVEQYGVRALKSGASGYLMKDAAPAELVNAIRQLLQGRKYISNSLGQTLAKRLNEDDEKDIFEVLSARELDVFRKIARGMSLVEIARSLSLSATSVSTYRSRILHKMNFSTNADIIQYAVVKGIV